MAAGKTARRAAALPLAGAVLACALAGPALAGQLSPADLQAYRAAFAAADQERWSDARRLAAGAGERLPAKVVTWLALVRTGASFDELSRFIDDNPDWPNQTGLRQKAESAIGDDLSGASVRAWFQRYPALTYDGLKRWLAALAEAGETAQVTELVRRRWAEGEFGPADEADFRSRYGQLLRQEDHWRRLDRLLWERDQAAVRRLLGLVDDDRRALAEARLALASDEITAPAKLERVPEALARDAGLLFEHAAWLRRRGLEEPAIEILRHPPENLGRADKWWTERQIMARRQLERRNYALAYELIATALPEDEGTAATEGHFLAGWVALSFLKQPEVALRHFQTLTKVGSTPITRARGAYWWGRAAEAAGDEQTANSQLAAAARYPTTFYGQLAAQRLGRRALLFPAPPQAPGAEAVAAFERQQLVRIVRLLFEIDPDPEHDRAGLFLRRMNKNDHEADDDALLARLAQEIRRPDLAIAFAKRALGRGVLLLDEGYPTIGLPETAGVEPALVLSVIRQESTFNPTTVSGPGARGLMQLMPETAALVGRKLGLKVDRAALNGNSTLNIRLGSAYLASLIERYNGSYVLAVAAYNAGPGRVSAWLASNGDPRSPNTDVVDWIEQIPIAETRNYVQRLMEATQVYRVRLGVGAGLTLEQDLRR